MLAAMAAFSVNDALVKFATSEIPPAQIMAVRGAMAGAALYLVATFRAQGQRPKLIASLRGPIGIRALADGAATISFITALVYMPLANATAILQALPLVVTLGAVLFFGERPGWRRWTAIAVGLAGVLVILRPGTEGFTIHSVAVLACVLACAVRDLVVRAIPQTTPSVSVAAVTAFTVMVLGLALLPFVGWRPMSLTTFGAMALAAGFIACAYVALATATRTGEIGVVAPFRYAVLVFAFILSTVAFGEPPLLLDLVGSAIVVASGIYVIYRERTVAKIPPVAPGAP